MKVACSDCRTPRWVSSMSWSKPSNSRLPPPRMTGATMMLSSSTSPAASAWRMMSAPPLMLDVLVAGSGLGPLDGLRDPVDEHEVVALGLLLGSVRDDEGRDAPRVLVAPVPRRLVHPPARDRGAHPGEGGIHPLLLDPAQAGPGLGARLRVVGPRPAEDPVVQPLAALSQAHGRAVVGSGDVAVDRGRDARAHLAHLCLLVLALRGALVLPGISTGDSGPELIARPSHRALRPAASLAR